MATSLQNLSEYDASTFINISQKRFGLVVSEWNREITDVLSAGAYDTLLKHAIEGIRAMPAKGGNPDLDDVEVARTVVYIANKSGAKFKEPDVPAAPPVAPAQAAATTPAVTAAAPVATLLP